MKLAAVVSPVKRLHYKGTDFTIPIVDKLQSGELTSRIMSEITDIQSGKKVFDDWVFKI